MKKYTIKYKVGARKIDAETFEQFEPVVFQLIVETDVDTNKETIRDTKLKFVGTRTWSEQKAISIALNEMHKLKTRG